MEEKLQQVCHWCQSEIVWDPEIGPEDTCPHCFNELGDYRSVSLDRLMDSDEDEDAEEVSARGQRDDFYDEDEQGSKDPFEQAVQAIVDRQDEAPECSNCREFMLLAGEQEVSKNEFVAAVPAILGKPFMNPTFKVNVYVCPSCFKVDQLLSDDDRLKLVQRLRQSGLKD